MKSPNKSKLVKLLKEYKKETEPQVGKRSTVGDCVDFLLATLGEKV